MVWPRSTGLLPQRSGLSLALCCLPAMVRNSICKDFPWSGLWLLCLVSLAAAETGPSLPCLFSDFLGEIDSL